MTGKRRTITGAEELLNEIEARVRTTIGPTYTSRDGYSEPVMIGSISERDFEALIGMVRSIEAAYALAVMPPASAARH